MRNSHARDRSGSSIPTRSAVRVGTGLYAVAAAGFALATATDSHRVWAVLATMGYLPAFVTAGRVADSGFSVLGVAGIWTALVSTGVLVLFQIRQPEVGVVERSAEVLFDTGSPYLQDPAHLLDVNSYPPGMALFGLPRRLLGDTILADARLWFLVVFILAVTRPPYWPVHIYRQRATRLMDRSELCSSIRTR